MAGNLRIAIIGAGPSGFYTADTLVKETGGSVGIDLIDRLPNPYGLVRAGVAPDHPNIKSVTRIFDKTAVAPGVRFIGGVEVGRDVSHHELGDHYNAVVYALGAPRDRRLGIPGENLPGSFGAAEFVGWYNGHPDHSELPVDLRVERAIVVGNGNVALDIARILTTPVTELARTDIADHALKELSGSRIREVVVLGRRGPAQAAWTNPELLELGRIAGVGVQVDLGPLSHDAWRALQFEGIDKVLRHNLEITRAYAEAAGDAQRRIQLRFLASPTEILGTDRVTGVRIVRNRLAEADDGSSAAHATNLVEELDAGLVVSSTGFRTPEVEGVPYDCTRGVLANNGGRVQNPSNPAPSPGVYVTGWAKRGPLGVIGSNKQCGRETALAVLDDAATGLLPTPPRSPAMFDSLLAERRPARTGWEGWQAIDEAERRAGAAARRPRVKITNLTWLTDIALRA